jgi:hypothetical protein
MAADALHAARAAQPRGISRPTKSTGYAMPSSCIHGVGWACTCNSKSRVTSAQNSSSWACPTALPTQAREDYLNGT